MHSLPLYFITSVLVIGGLIDLKSRKIPNWLTYPVLAVSLLWLSRESLVIIGLAILITLIFNGVVGAGDIKLATAVSLWSIEYRWSNYWLLISLTLALGGSAIGVLVSYLRNQNPKAHLNAIALGPYMAIGFLFPNLSRYFEVSR